MKLGFELGLELQFGLESGFRIRVRVRVRPEVNEASSSPTGYLSTTTPDPPLARDVPPFPVFAAPEALEMVMVRWYDLVVI